jgi:hypothetical protein
LLHESLHQTKKYVECRLLVVEDATISYGRRDRLYVAITRRDDHIPRVHGHILVA